MSYPPSYGYPVVPVAGQVVVQPYRCSTAHVVIAWICAVLTLGYLLPWAIAATRDRRNVAAIALVNIFLGWSLVAWVVALVLACSSDQPVVVLQPVHPVPVGWGPPAAWQPAAPPPYLGPPAPAPYVGPPALPPAPQHRGPEPTRVDPLATDPTQQLPTSPWQRPFDPPAYGPGSTDHR